MRRSNANSTCSTLFVKLFRGQKGKYAHQNAILKADVLTELQKLL